MQGYLPTKGGAGFGPAGRICSGAEANQPGRARTAGSRRAPPPALGCGPDSESRTRAVTVECRRPALPQQVVAAPDSLGESPEEYPAGMEGGAA